MFYRVWYPVRLKIRTRYWSVSYLEFSRWPPSGSALISCRNIKNLTFYEVLRLLIWSLSVHRPEEARFRYLETCGALNHRSIKGISQFLLVIQSVQIQNPRSSVSFQGDHLTTESKSDFNSDNTLFSAYRQFKLVYSLVCNSSLRLIEGRCFKAFPSNFVLSHRPNPIIRS